MMKGCIEVCTGLGNVDSSDLPQLPFCYLSLSVPKIVLIYGFQLAVQLRDSKFIIRTGQRKNAYPAAHKFAISRTAEFQRALEPRIAINAR